MIQKFANWNTSNYGLDIMNRFNDWCNNHKKYLATPANMEKHLSSKSYRLQSRLFGDSLLTTILIFGFVLSPIQKSLALPSISAETNMTTTYSSILTSKSLMFSRHPDQITKRYYYESIPITVSVMGTYTFMSKSDINTDGCLYYNQFDPMNPSLKLISENDNSTGEEQFKITAILQPSQKYILVVTTYIPETTGTFSIVVSGSAMVDFGATRILTESITERASTTYSGELESSSPVFARPDKTERGFYYHVIQVTVSLFSTYTFKSDSIMDTYGLFYSYSFDPSYPSQNMLQYDDDGGGNRQFLIQSSLQSGQTYFLVVTTYEPRLTGSFSIMASGPGVITLRPYQFPTINTTPTGPYNTYSTSLSLSSPVFSRPGREGYYYYYHAIQVTVSTSGSYIFSSKSSVDTYGCFYSHPFNPSYPSQNLMKSDDDSGGNAQFQMTVLLRSGQIYVLVVTTYSNRETGSVLINSLGSGLITMSSYRPASMTTTATPSYNAYSGYLSSGISPMFFRPSGIGQQYYYYQAIQITASSSGTYRFTSVSSIDTYGCFYSYPFDPSYPSQNLMASNDDSGSSSQFLMTVNLRVGQTYVLVVTTFGDRVMGSFSTTGNGSGTIQMVPYTPSTSRPIRTTTYSSCSYYGTCEPNEGNNIGKIIGITIGCFAFMLIICVLGVYCKKKTSSASISNSSIRNQTTRTQPNFSANMNRNAPRPYAPQGSYTIPMSAPGNIYQEEVLPSYDIAMSYLKAQEQRNPERF